MRPTDEQLAAQLRDSISEQAQAARQRLGISQTEVATRMGNTSAYYGRIERGTSLPGVETLAQLCAVLGVSADDLLAVEELGDAGAEREVSPELASIVAQIRDNPELCSVVIGLINAAEA